MRMNLKNTADKKIFTIKNILIFIVSLLIVGVIAGIVFYGTMKINDKIIVKDNIFNYFNDVGENTNYFHEIKASLLNNILYVSLTWILGISVIGIVIILFMLFFKGFTTGFTISSIVGKYKVIFGGLGSILYLIPDKILSIFLVIYMSYYAVLFGIKLFMYLFLKKELDMRAYLKKYLKRLIIGLILAIIISILEVFATPFVLKIFTFIVK